jgi:nucleolar GTP-binding protein
MYEIPTILYYEELLDKVFHKASKLSENPKIRNRFVRKKKYVISVLNTVGDSLNSNLNKYIKAFPSFDQVHRFEFELIDIIIGMDKLRKSLGAVNWARNQIMKLKQQINSKVMRVRNQSEYSKLEQLRKMYYGRVSSILAQVGNDLRFLNSTRDSLKKLPKIDPDMTTIVVAGYPNVGKSLLVKRISSAKPMVATYPFTTKQLNLGHTVINKQKIQIIDTPGLLDHSPEKRNKIEKQAIMALQHLANIIIFILDPSEHCGYGLEEQTRLLEEVQTLFQSVKIIDIENKVDIFSSDTNRMKISAMYDKGINELMDIIQKSI